MTWVKICGITNLEDAQTAVEAGADALGFVFYEKSPRNVTPKIVRDIVQKLPAHIEKVGVFVAEHTNDYVSTIHEAGLTASQMVMGLLTEHSAGALGAKSYGLGCFPPGFKNYWSFPAAFFVENQAGARKWVADLAAALDKFSSQPCGDTMKNFFQAVFIDSSTPQQLGGTGKVFEWKSAAEIVNSIKGTIQVVVAGGLTPENVSEAMQILHPWGVDVSSGVEALPGRKDPLKVRAFIKAVRESEKN
jgi:phosphoribosylanthranilate isomerase